MLVYLNLKIMRYLNTILEDVNTPESLEVKEVINRKIDEERVRNRKKEKKRYRKKIGFID